MLLYETQMMERSTGKKKMCDKFLKPTGKAGATHDFILCCQRVQL
jgi:hypothetical protein